MNRTATRLDETIRTLTEERNLSTAILGSMVEGVAVVNGSERLLFANKGFAEILGLELPLKSGKALVEIVRQTELIEAVRHVLRGEARVEAEIATGTLRQHFFAATVASVRAGATLGAVVVLHDISELRRLERVRRDFVANVSHEFKTPLTAIQGFAETLLAGALDDPENRERFLGIILEHARRLARLTDDLLRLSQMDSDRLELEIDELSVAQIVDSCLPDGTITGDYEKYCASYEEDIQRAGGIDLQILGIGRNGHIGFNEPTSSFASKTRLKVLSKATVDDNRKFFSAGETVPRCAITMGIGTILRQNVS